MTDKKQEPDKDEAPALEPSAEIKIEDNVRLILRNEDTGEVVHDSTHNVVTASGKAAIANQLLAAPTLGKPTHMALGTGAPAANALGAEIVGSRVALTSKTVAGAVVTMQGDFAAGVGTGALTEAGIFDAAAAGNMHMSTAFAAVNKDANMSLTIIWTLTVN